VSSVANTTKSSDEPHARLGLAPRLLAPRLLQAEGDAAQGTPRRHRGIEATPLKPRATKPLNDTTLVAAP
jgi:hypothetical protein